MSQTMTAAERYAKYFWAELKKHPDVPPDRTVISKKMGWKSPNHSGEMPKIRCDLLTKAGFVLIANRYYKGTFVDEHLGYKLGDRTYRDAAFAQHGAITSIAVAGERCQFIVTWIYHREDGVNTFTTPANSDEIGSLVLPADLSPDSVERWLRDA